MNHFSVIISRWFEVIMDVENLDGIFDGEEEDWNVEIEVKQK